MVRGHTQGLGFRFQLFVLGQVHTLRVAAFSFAHFFFRFLFWFIIGLKFLCIFFAALVVAQLCFFVLPFIDFQAIFFSFQFVFLLIQEQNFLSLSLSHSVGFTTVFCCVGEGKSLGGCSQFVLQSCTTEWRSCFSRSIVSFFIETKCGLFLFFLAGGDINWWHGSGLHTSSSSPLMQFLYLMSSTGGTDQ
jgi:hypothetical protein